MASALRAFNDMERGGTEQRKLPSLGSWQVVPWSNRSDEIPGGGRFCCLASTYGRSGAAGGPGRRVATSSLSSPWAAAGLVRKEPSF